MSEKDTNEYYITRQNSTESNARSYPRKFPFAIAKAKGSWVEDVEGNKYLDFLCGAGTLALGHNDDEVNQAMIEMLQNDLPLHTLDLTTPVKDTFVHTLLSVLPPELGNNAKVQFCSPSGTDATDAAIKLCKTATGRSSVISFAGGYHGMGQGPLACMGNLHAKTAVNGLMPDVHSFPYPYAYRDPFGLGGEAGVKAACNFFERTLKDPESGITLPACVILEAIQGEGGVIPAPVEFLQTVRRVTKELGIPLILDEIQCGMGRSGKMFAFEYAGIIPDVVLISKALGGSQPMAVVVYNKVSKPEFLADVSRKGDLIRSKLEELKSKVSIIGDVRGKGLMIGTEFVDPNGQADCIGSLPTGGDIAAKVQKICFENGLMVEKGGRNGSVMRCLCALNITDKDLAKAFAIFEKAVLAVDKEYK